MFVLLVGVYGRNCPLLPPPLTVGCHILLLDLPDRRSSSTFENQNKSNTKYFTLVPFSFLLACLPLHWIVRIISPPTSFFPLRLFTRFYLNRFSFLVRLSDIRMYILRLFRKIFARFRCILYLKLRRVRSSNLWKWYMKLFTRKYKGMTRGVLIY